MTISLRIVASPGESRNDVSFTGADVALISNQERGTFQLNDQQLKRAVERDF